MDDYQEPNSAHQQSKNLLDQIYTLNVCVDLVWIAHLLLWASEKMCFLVHLYVVEKGVNTFKKKKGKSLSF